MKTITVSAYTFSELSDKAKDKVMNAKTYKVLSIDAWEDGFDGWTCNAWYNAGAIALDINSEDETILEAMVDEGYITQIGANLSMVEQAAHCLLLSTGNEDDPQSPSSITRRGPASVIRSLGLCAGPYPEGVHAQHGTRRVLLR